MHNEILHFVTIFGVLLIYVQLSFYSFGKIFKFYLFMYNSSLQFLAKLWGFAYLCSP